MNIIDAIESQLPVVDSIPPSGVSNVGKRVADEMAFWQGKNENDAEAYPALARYWENIQFENWTPAGTPWSAAFISYVLRGTGFPGNAAHYRYVESIVDQVENDEWSAYSIPKNLSKIKLEPGDVLVRSRGSGTPQSAEYWATHGDVVWRIAGNEAQLVGGNLSNSARIASKIPVNNDGKPISAIPQYKVILKKKKGDGRWLWVIIGILAIGAYTQRKRLTG